MDEEEKIIEEIKRRVLEEEERLKKNREKESVLEALESVTHLSKEQILAIEAQVRKENELRKIQKNKRKRLLLTTSSMLLVLMVIVVWQLYERTLPPKIVPLLHDTFDEPTSSLWTEKQVYDYRKIHENGAYSFEVGKNWCYWDNVSLYFPENYTIEVHSVWKEGSYQTFGVMLLQDNKNYSLFQMSLAQKAAYVESIDGNYSDFVAKDAKVQVGENVQKIVVGNGQFSYFINDELVERGNLNANFNYVMLALRVCGVQKVNFTYVSVKNDDTGKYILKEDFRKPRYEWDFEQSYTTKFSFIDGQYRLDVKDKGYCNFNTIPFSSFSTDDYIYEISIDCYWQSGENDSFGLMIDQDNNNTLNFELQSNGKARVSKYVNGKNTLTTAFKETKQLSTFRQAVTQKIKILNKGKNYEYYVNEKVVDKGTVDFPINYIGLRACGEQVVHFDNLEIKKIEVKD